MRARAACVDDARNTGPDDSVRAGERAGEDVARGRYQLRVARVSEGAYDCGRGGARNYSRVCSGLLRVIVETCNPGGIVENSPRFQPWDGVHKRRESRRDG